MNRERFQKLRSIFEEALELEPDQQSAFIEEEAAGDESLRAEIEALLDAHRADEAGLVSVACDVRSFLEPLERDEYEPTTIGHYEVIRKLGEGGMGAVYLCRDTRLHKRLVAVKMLRSPGSGRSVIERFQRERNFLGKLRHPHIAALYDEGQGERGEPYFVMEYVEGVDIVTYCNSKSLSVEERLRLMVQVCRAVQSAHSESVAHRDLKPANILIVDAEKPYPKIIDFGVARSLAGSSDVMATLTQANMLVGTLGYIAPEQIDTPSASLTPRADIYALGVILFELMTGSQPIPADQLRRSSIIEVHRMLSGYMAPRPSALVQSESAAEKLPRCGLSASQLAERLRGDIDSILLKAVAPQPLERYTTADALADDLQRHLDMLPIQARPRRKVATAMLFVRRHKIAMTFAACLAVVLVAATVVSVVSARRAMVARALAEQRSETLLTNNYRSNMALAGAALTGGDWRKAAAWLNQAPVERREWEWRMMMALATGPWSSMSVNPSAVSAIGARASGGLVALGFRDRTLALVDPNTRRIVASTLFESLPEAIFWSESSSSLIVASRGGEIVCLESDLTERCRHQVEVKGWGSIGYDERTHELVAFDNERQLWRVNLATGDVSSKSAPELGSRSSAALSANGRWIGVIDESGSWRTIDAATLTPLAQWHGPKVNASELVVSDNGDLACHPLGGREVILARIGESGVRRVAMVSPGSASMLGMAFSPRADALLIQDPGGVSQICEFAKAGPPITVAAPAVGQSTVGWAADGDSVVVGYSDGVVRTLRLADARRRHWPSELHGAILARSDAGSQQTEIMTNQGRWLRRSWRDGEMTTALVAENRITAAWCSGGVSAIGYNNGSVECYFDDMRRAAEPLFNSTVRAIRGTPNGDVFVAASMAQEYAVISTTDWSIRRETPPTRSLLTGLAVRDDGQEAAFAYVDGLINLVNLADGAVRESLDTGLRNAVAAYDGRSLIVGSTSSVVARFETDGGDLEWSQHLGDDPVRTVIGHPSGRILVGTHSGAIVILDPEDGAIITSFTILQGSISSIEIDSVSHDVTVCASSGDVFELPAQLYVGNAED